MKYSKPAINISEQIVQLEGRGLIIKDKSFAQKTLENVSYYRLAGYWWPMQADKEKHTFKSKSTFENVVALYNFDRELRLLLFGVIETIEISFRTKLIYHLSREVSPWWFENSSLYENTDEFVGTMSAISSELLRSKEIFIKEHKRKYKLDSRFPPAWKTLEIASFGNLSKLYGNLKPSVKSKDIVADELGTVNHTFLPSWLQSINQIRNICAHHGRLWNKNLPGRPKLLPKPPYPWITRIPPADDHYMLYIHLCCMKYIVNIINPENKFTESLTNLMSDYPNIDPNALGFIEDWGNEALWTKSK